MTLKFEINNNIISKGHSDYIPNDDSGDLFASFVFNTKDWKHLEKYAIFWNRKGKSTIRYITDKSHGSCPVPHMALDDLYFYVQVYANDDMLTQKLKVYNYDCPTDKKTVDEMPETIMADIAEELTKEYLIPYSGPVTNCRYYVISEYGVQDQEQIQNNNGFYAKYGETIAYVWKGFKIDGNSGQYTEKPLQTFIVDSNIIENGIYIDSIDAGQG